MAEISPAHRTVEMEDLPALRDLLNSGVDINEEFSGLTLLHHSVDVEVDGHNQTGEPLHVNTTAYLLAKGADPTLGSHGGTGVPAEHVAFTGGHWVAYEIFQAWKGHRNS